jgi:hypothetical protein
MRMTGTVGNIVAMTGAQDVVEIRCGEQGCMGDLFRIHATAGRASVFCTVCGREALELHVQHSEDG